MGAYGWSHHLRGEDLETVFNETVTNNDRGYEGVTGVTRATSQVCHPREAAYLSGQLADGYSLTPEHSWNDEEARAAAEKVADARASKILARLGASTSGLTTQQVTFSGYGTRTAYRATARGATVDDLPCPQKWGTAYAIPTADEGAFTLTERAVPIDVTRLGAPNAAPYAPEIVEHVHDALAEQLGHHPRIADIEILDDNPDYATKVASTAGNVVTRYRIYTRDHWGNLHPVRCDPEPTMAKARQKITDLLAQPVPADRGPSTGNVEYVALGEKVRADGSPLLAGRRELVSRLVVYRVTLVTPKGTLPPPVTGWQVYGVTAD